MTDTHRIAQLEAENAALTAELQRLEDTGPLCALCEEDLYQRMAEAGISTERTDQLVELARQRNEHQARADALAAQVAALHHRYEHLRDKIEELHAKVNRWPNEPWNGKLDLKVFVQELLSDLECGESDCWTDVMVVAAAHDAAIRRATLERAVEIIGKMHVCDREEAELLERTADALRAEMEKETA